MSEMNTNLPDHADAAHNLADWLARLGAKRTDVAADLMDIIHAAKQCEQAVAELLTLDPTDTANAGAIARCWGRIHAWMLGEVQVHAASFAEGWPDIDAALEASFPADEE